MANWCNARLVVAGRRAEVVRFARLVRARPSAVFRSDMLVGEVDPLRPVRLETLAGGLARKTYLFQIRNDDGREYFSGLSSRFPTLHFVLTYFDPHAPPYAGSFLIARGRSRAYQVSDELFEAVMDKHGYTDDADEEDDWRFWEASFELMDRAQAHWDAALRRALDAQQAARGARVARRARPTGDTQAPIGPTRRRRRRS